MQQASNTATRSLSPRGWRKTLPLEARYADGLDRLNGNSLTSFGPVAVNFFNVLQAVAGAATAVGVAIAAWQLVVAKREAQSRFEEGLTEQYRAIATDLPLGALLGKPLPEDELVRRLRAFYNYFDLSNEQAFLAERKRVRKDTWANWQEGIVQLMSRPAFQDAWLRLAPDLDGSFDDLRQLLPRELKIPSRDT